MTGHQLTLVEAPAEPKLTARQQAVLEIVRAAGIDGVDAADAGALAHTMKERPHGLDQRCEFCGKDGQRILGRLREFGLVTYRRKSATLPGAWISAEFKGARPERVISVPYGEFPDGY